MIAKGRKNGSKNTGTGSHGAGAADRADSTRAFTATLCGGASCAVFGTGAGAADRGAGHRYFTAG